MRARLSLFVAVVGSTLACTTSPGSAIPRYKADAPLGSFAISSSELEKQNGSLYEAIANLRPWLRAQRGTQIFVSIDDAPLTDLTVLNTIQPSTVREVRLLRGSSSVGRVAVGPDGAMITGDVIAITTRGAAKNR